MTIPLTSRVPKGTPLPERIRTHSVIDPLTGCWIWQCSLHQLGYGHITVSLGGRRQVVRKAHRASYEVFVGPIPEGLELDHLCRNRACVNPAHLEPVTHAENLRRSPLLAAYHERQKTEAAARRLAKAVA